MIQLIRSWLTGVTCAAMIAALAESLMPQGAVRQVGRLACGLVLLWAALRPVQNMDPGGLTEYADGLRDQTRQRQLVLEEESGAILKTLIERESGAYIVDKAAEQGIVCRAEVTCAAEESGLWLPWSVRITGAMEPEQRGQLSRMIEAQLDIPLQRQDYTQVIGGEPP